MPLFPTFSTLGLGLSASDIPPTEAPFRSALQRRTKQSFSLTLFSYSPGLKMLSSCPVVGICTTSSPAPQVNFWFPPPDSAYTCSMTLFSYLPNQTSILRPACWWFHIILPVDKAEAMNWVPCLKIILAFLYPPRSRNSLQMESSFSLRRTKRTLKSSTITYSASVPHLNPLTNPTRLRQVVLL